MKTLNKAAIACILIGALGFIAWFPGTLREPQAIRQTKAAVLPACPGHTIDQVARVMDKPEWHTWEDANGSSRVSVEGGILLHAQPVQATLQFVVYDGSPQYQALLIDGVVSENAGLLAFALLETLCESAGWDTIRHASAMPAAKPAAVETMPTTGGTLAIQGTLNAMRLLANGKDLGVGAESVALSFKQSFKVNEADVVMVADAVSATCQQYFFVTLASRSDIKVTPSFGTCDDGPTVTQSGPDIRVAMLDAKGSQVVYLFEGGVVTH